MFPIINKMKEMVKMFQSFNNSKHNQEGTSTLANQLSVKLRMPLGYQGKNVPASVVMMELLWQQYGLDLLHPEVSRWLEQHAPEVKALVAGDGRHTSFTVGPKSTIEMHLSLRTDDRLREVSSQYILSQAQHSMAPQRGLRLVA